MKKLTVFLMFLLMIFLAACGGEETEDKEVGSVESSSETDNSENEEVTEEAVEEEETEEESTEETEEINQVLADNEHVMVTVVNIAKVEDKDWDEERYEVNMEIENRRDDTIEVQTHEVSADDVMIDDMVYFSETVAGGKKANATMVIENYEGDLPVMENNLEFVLDIFSHDDYEFEDKHDVVIEFN